MSFITNSFLENYWWVFAFAMMFVNMTMFLVNQKHKNIQGSLLVFWRGVVPAVILAPIVLQMDWPTSPWFYIATVVTSFIVTYTDTVKMDGPRLYGAAVYSRLAPAGIWVAFIGWFLWSAEYRQEVYERPVGAIMVFSAVWLGYYAVMRIKEKCEISWDALGYIGLAVFLSGFTAIFNKTAMIHSGLWQGVLIYAFIQALIIPTVKVITNKRKGIQLKDYFTPSVRNLGILMGCLFICLGITKNLAMTGVSNPAYVTLIGLSQPVLFVVLNFLLNKEDRTDKKSGFMLVGSVVILVLGSQTVSI